MFLRIFQHLLPNAKAWRLTIDKPLRRFFVGLSGIGSDVSNFLDLVWLDIFPETTRELLKWEDQFGLPNTLTDEQDRRDRLAATWQALGGQSPRYIQDTLQAAGFDVYVHEWWVPGTEPAINVKAAATARNPFTYLNDGVAPIRYPSSDGVITMNDGAAEAMDGVTVNPSGYPLVNKIYIASQTIQGDGSPVMIDGGASAMDGKAITVYSLKQYLLLADITTYPYYLYIGGATFPDHANVDQSRRNEFETLCLKICPAQQWLGMLIDYS